MLTVNGRVGLVLDGRTLGWPAILMMSGAWPPPAPSVWKLWIARPLIAAIESSMNPHSFERVGVDGDLDVVLVGHRQAGVDDRERGAPVLVELEAAGAGLDHVPRAASPGCRCPCRGCRR